MYTHVLLENQGQVLYQIVLLLLPGGVCANHEAHSLIEHVYLMSLQVLNGDGEFIQQL